MQPLTSRLCYHLKDYYRLTASSSVIVVDQTICFLLDMTPVWQKMIDSCWSNMLSTLTILLEAW